MNAKSALPLMRGETSRHRRADDWLGYELFGNSAIFHGDYKALRLGAWLESAGVEGAGAWQLYDLKNDPSELRNLSEQEPERLAEMVAKYAEYSASMNIIDVPRGFQSSVDHCRRQIEVAAQQQAIKDRRVEQLDSLLGTSPFSRSMRSSLCRKLLAIRAPPPSRCDTAFSDQSTSGPVNMKQVALVSVSLTWDMDVCTLHRRNGENWNVAFDRAAVVLRTREGRA